MGTVINRVDTLEFSSQTAPAVSAAGLARCYQSSADNIARLSQNAGAYVPLLNQTGFSELAADQSTNSATFADLLTVAITARGDTRLVIHATLSTSATLAGIAIFRITLDGAALRGFGVALAGGGAVAPQSGGIVYRTAVVAAGARSVKLQWRGSAINLAVAISPVAQVDTEHASLYVEELSA